MLALLAAAGSPTLGPLRFTHLPSATKSPSDSSRANVTDLIIPGFISVRAEGKLFCIFVEAGQYKGVNIVDELKPSEPHKQFTVGDSVPIIAR